MASVCSYVSDRRSDKLSVTGVHVKSGRSSSRCRMSWHVWGSMTNILLFAGTPAPPAYSTRSKTQAWRSRSIYCWQLL